jgi:hypothetical protein
MEQPENARVGVVQTPYSAIPHPTSLLERTAGATTDIQYLIHQGFTHYRATYWVGANALVRKAALDEISVVAEERGFPIRRYIQDRTVIEDTESTVDLVARGWQLHNYPDRLAYSATPPDFGALFIQRQRWANGGLLILPKLLRYLLAARGASRGRLAEGFMRFHYLVSICAVNLGLVFLIVNPLRGDLNSAWLPLAAAPYYLLYGRDLQRLGYAKIDVLRVYALNLALIPINLAGVGKSLQQALTGKKIPFGRTPKVLGRTSAPAWCILAEFALAGYLVLNCLVDIYVGRWAHAIFAAGNAAFLGYAVGRFVGWRASLEDISLQWQPRRERTTAPRLRHILARIAERIW